MRNTPAVNVIRLLGNQSDNPTADDNAKAGWKIDNVGTADTDGGAYGLFVVPSGSGGAGSPVTGTLAAVWYLKDSSITLSGALAGSPSTFVSGTNTLISSTGPYAEFKASVITPSGIVTGKQIGRAHV